MSEMPLIDIRPDHWEIVRSILLKHVPNYEVWAFGSRAKWTAKPYSDLDLAIVTDEPLPLAVSAALADDFSESDLPYRVDVVDLCSVSDALKAIVEKDRISLLPSSNPLKTQMNSYTFADLIEITKDGEWGEGTPSDDTQPMLVIRGTDFVSATWFL
ncbi:hypothetical protein CCP2SC5_810011 [Azospirillaceae bacterium]